MKKIILIVVLLLPFLFQGCKKDNVENETVVTMEAISIDANTATVMATFNNIKNCPENPQRGICWSTAKTPATRDRKQTYNGCDGGGDFKMTGLTTKTLYFVRAYCLSTNSAGIVYGNEISFTTK